MITTNQPICTFNNDGLPVDCTPEAKGLLEQVAFQAVSLKLLMQASLELGVPKVAFIKSRTGQSLRIEATEQGFGVFLD